MKIVLAWLTLTLLAPGQVEPTQTTEDRNLIVGAWSLSSYKLRLKPSGTVTTLIRLLGTLASYGNELGASTHPTWDCSNT